MGVAIWLRTDNKVEALADLNPNTDTKYWLSRTFCNFMSRKNVVNHEAELDQIGKLIGIDIAPVYAMESAIPYDPEENDYFGMSKEEYLELTQGQEEAPLKNNIVELISVFDAMIAQLSQIPNLPALLLPTTFDTLDNANYFADFNKEEGHYVNNNFGQDLRTIQRFLSFARENDSKTIGFHYM